MLSLNISNRNSVTFIRLVLNANDFDRVFFFVSAFLFFFFMLFALPSHSFLEAFFSLFFLVDNGFRFAWGWWRVCRERPDWSIRSGMYSVKFSPFSFLAHKIEQIEDKLICFFSIILFWLMKGNYQLILWKWSFKLRWIEFLEMSNAYVLCLMKVWWLALRIQCLVCHIGINVLVHWVFN